LNFAGLDWRLPAVVGVPAHAGMLLAAAVVMLAAGGIVAWRRLRPRDPLEVERRRRAYLNQVGRIIEARILEITEGPGSAPPARTGRVFGKRRSHPSRTANGARKLVVYSYTISGVSYETAQDVTELEEHACLDRVMAGQPASVKYDPANPSNSILIADDWSGLH
jgi:hypothetical protein